MQKGRLDRKCDEGPAWVPLPRSQEQCSVGPCAPFQQLERVPLDIPKQCPCFPACMVPWVPKDQKRQKELHLKPAQCLCWAGAKSLSLPECLPLPCRWPGPGPAWVPFEQLGRVLMGLSYKVPCFFPCMVPWVLAPACRRTVPPITHLPRGGCFPQLGRVLMVLKLCNPCSFPCMVPSVQGGQEREGFLFPPIRSARGHILQRETRPKSSVVQVAISPR